MSNAYSKNPTLLITGCTKGIGLAITQIFAKNGFNVAGCARSTDQLEELFKQLSTLYPHQQFFLEACDVRDKEQVITFAKDALQEFGSIDVLVNNAGLFLPGALLEEPDGQFEDLLNINLHSAYHLTRVIAPEMVKNKRGHIFNMCSIASLKAYPNGGTYSIAKFALHGFSQVLREELKKDNVRVTALLPGATYTQSWEGANLPEERFMKTDDLAKIVYASYELSGQTDVEQIVIRPILGDI